MNDWTQLQSGHMPNFRVVPIALTKSALKLSGAAAKLYLRKHGARRAVPWPFLSLLGSSEALMG